MEVGRATQEFTCLAVSASPITCRRAYTSITPREEVSTAEILIKLLFGTWHRMPVIFGLFYLAIRQHPHQQYNLINVGIHSVNVRNNSQDYPYRKHNGSYNDPFEGAGGYKTFFEEMCYLRCRMIRDASVVYGRLKERQDRVRTYQDGKLKIAESGLLPRDDDGIAIPGDVRNSWVGVSTLQALFIKEYNAVCDAIKPALFHA
ncbi:hypothetical protein Fmac_024303 [Flemingia macrophylla]|uniref:Uncharacterized protein n=1 Tax=Flemingia macrophylla TaxID=520843 RepID=A0ABD1LNZ2_9FABA